ncbi:hypothetical protein ABEB36_004804 [Hypothenemus hampei]
MQLLDNLGLNVGYFTIKWKTKAFNRLLIKWGNYRPQFWQFWFDIGTYISIGFLIVTLLFLILNQVGIIFSKSTENPIVTIEPVIPGVNLPISELGYYSFTLLICSVVHEAGHALAAILDDVGIQEFGCNLYVILPVAYTRIPTDKLSALNLRRQLRIFTAGVWHNILLSLMGFILFCLLPVLFAPFYHYEMGVNVVKISKTSPLRDAIKGLLVNDVITAINDCPTLTEDDWYNCLNNKTILMPAVCISSNLVNDHDESVPLRHLGNGYVECCDSDNKKNLCFEFMEIGNNELELPGHVCLPGRIVMEKTTTFCTATPDKCPNDYYCFKPLLLNNTYLMKIVSQRVHVIYLGHPNDLVHTIGVSSFIRKNNLVPLMLPDRITRLVKYLIVISLGVAFVNILPIIFMDGEYILKTLGLITFKGIIQKQRIIHGSNFIVWLSSTILIIYIIYSIFLLL